MRPNRGLQRQPDSVASQEVLVGTALSVVTPPYGVPGPWERVSRSMTYGKNPVDGVQLVVCIYVNCHS